MPKKPPKIPPEEMTPGKAKRLKNLKSYGTPGAPPRRQDIPGSNKPWSVRNTIRHLARQDINPEIADPFKRYLGKKATPAEKIATAFLNKAMQGNLRAAEYVTEQIDGKLAQTNINADLAAIMSMTDEELANIVNGVDAVAEGRSSEA